MISCCLLVVARWSWWSQSSFPSWRRGALSLFGDPRWHNAHLLVAFILKMQPLSFLPSARAHPSYSQRWTKYCSCDAATVYIIILTAMGMAMPTTWSHGDEDHIRKLRNHSRLFVLVITQNPPIRTPSWGRSRKFPSLATVYRR